MGEVEELKAKATNTQKNQRTEIENGVEYEVTVLYDSRRVAAQDALLEIGTKEAMLALFDIASTETLPAKERDAALTKAKKIKKKQK